MPSLSSVVPFSLLLVLLLAVMGQDCATSRVQREARSRARSRVCGKNRFSHCVDLAKLQELIQEVQKDFTNTSHDDRILLKTVTFDHIKKHKKVRTDTEEDRPPLRAWFLSRFIISTWYSQTNTSHDDRILLKTVTFDKIKKHKKYHGCVLLKIIDFYREVLQRQDRNYPDLGGLLDEVKECIHPVKICEKLYQEAAGKPVNESKIEEDLELLSKDAAILQLQRLKAASKKVVELSERATLDKAMVELQGLEDYIQGRGLRRN